MAKKETSKNSKKAETIKITPMHFEMIGLPEIQELLKIPDPPKIPLPPNVSYCVARVIDKMQPEARIYFEERDKLLRQYEDTEKSEGLPEGQIEILKNKLVEFGYKDKELKNTEIDLGIRKMKIEVKDEKIMVGSEEMPNLSPIQWRFLLPIFTED